MTTVLVIGAGGFLGRNLCTVLRAREGLNLLEVDVDTAPEILGRGLREADVIYHLAGINRPLRPEDFESGNADYTLRLCRDLESLGRAPRLIFSSSTQALSDNPYGRSKRLAEEHLRGFAERSGAVVVVFRFPNVFGKWSRPNYNSAVATFCYNIAHDLPIVVSDSQRIVELIYIDDVVAALAAKMEAGGEAGRSILGEASPTRRITLGDLVAKITAFRAMRTTMVLPDFSDPFTRNLYATYLSHLAPEEWAYPLDMKSDARGVLAEFIKSASLGQIFISRTRPGMTRGNHYHQTKTEKFLVLEGEAIIRFRPVTGGEVTSHRVSGQAWRVLDIPPGTTHSIENVGSSDLITLFWSSEVFDPHRTDTISLEVNRG